MSNAQITLKQDSVVLDPVGMIVLPCDANDVHTVSLEPDGDYIMFVNELPVIGSISRGGQAHFGDVQGILDNFMTDEKIVIYIGGSSSEPLPDSVRVLINESYDVTTNPYETYILPDFDENIYTESIVIMPNVNTPPLFRLYNNAWGIMSSTGEISFERFHQEAAEDIHSDSDKVMINDTPTVRLGLYNKTILTLTENVPGPLEIVHTYYKVD